VAEEREAARSELRALETKLAKLESLQAEDAAMRTELAAGRIGRAESRAKATCCRSRQQGDRHAIVASGELTACPLSRVEQKSCARS
jgi:hypothetical protein